MKRKKRGSKNDNGFKEWGGYMEAKKSKLQDQFQLDAAREPVSDGSQIFHGISIFVNGYSVPSADELKLLMMKHGGVYHHYYRTGKTTHIIATNLPDTKVKQLKNMNVVKPDWIVESIAAGKLLDYRHYLLYSHQSKTQPKLMFKSTYNVLENKETSYASNSLVKDDVNVSSNPEDAVATNELPQEMECFIESAGTSFGLKEKVAPKGIQCGNKVTPSITEAATHIKNASEAGFLSEFYNNSRLHHISTMGATFKQYVNSLRENNTGVFPGLEKLKMLKQNETFGIPGMCTSSFIPKYKSTIMHIDMDCFFVSVGLRNRPDLKGLPVAVTHAKAGSEKSSYRSGVNRKAEFDLYKSKREEKYEKTILDGMENDDVKPWSNWVEAIDETNSMSEIASCNYEARKFGLKNGMFLGQALKLCPNLNTIPYNFEGYKEVSYCLYDTVASYTLNIEAISCDEMFVDCTSLLNTTGTTPLQLASLLRDEIKTKTSCCCSAGFGSNRLQARLATKKAKPDGQFFLEPADVQSFMLDIMVADLPGVGRSTSHKLSSLGVKTCLDLQQISLAKLQAEFGIKNGESLYKCCRGEDPKKLVFNQIRKSVSAEVNYGIRFKNVGEAETFLQELSKEVYKRLKEVNMKTKFVTLKFMIRAKDAPVESAKFLGHGVCDSISRSTSLQTSLADLDSIIREVMSLSRQLSVDPTELRGIGIQLSRLESTFVAKPTGNIIDKFLRPKTENQKEVKKELLNCAATSSVEKVNKQVQSQSKIKPIKATDIDNAVLEALPEDIRQEVMQNYGLKKLSCEHENRMEPSESCVYNCGINYSQIDLDVLDELPLEIKREIESTAIRNNKKTIHNPSDDDSVEQNIINSPPKDDGPKLDRNLSLGEIRSLIKAWTASEDCPQPCDINMMADYLQGLVVSRHLDSLHICISCLHRCIEKRQNLEWEEAYHTIISNVQGIMVALYGLPLHVPRPFKH